MSLNNHLFLICQNIIADLKGPKWNINCTMDDVRGDVLRPSPNDWLVGDKAPIDHHLIADHR